MTSNQNHAYSMMGPELSKPSCLEQQAHWYAVYTCSRHEKRVAEQLDERRIENFLPVYEAVRRWSDRVKRLEFPLFPSYLFVRIGSRERLRVLQVPSVVSIVGSSEGPVPLPDGEIQALRAAVACKLRTEPYAYLKTGRWVRVIAGPLAGVEGVLMRRKNDLRLILSVDIIRQSVAVEVDEADVQPIACPGSASGNPRGHFAIA